MADEVARRRASDGGLSMRFDATLAGFEDARPRLRAFLIRAGASERTIHRSELAFEEICVNVIRYAHPDDPTDPHGIDVDARAVGDEIVLTIEDDGRPFDPTTAPPHAPASRLEEASIGGRGIALARSATRRMTYARRGDRNRLTLVLGRD